MTKIDKSMLWMKGALLVEASQPEQLASVRVIGFGEAFGQPDQAQLTLGAIIAIDETTGQLPGPVRNIGGDSFDSSVAAPTSISPGHLSYQSQVQVTFELVQ